VDVLVVVEVVAWACKLCEGVSRAAPRMAVAMGNNECLIMFIRITDIVKNSWVFMLRIGE
jgi:hypothetical protein